MDITLCESDNCVKPPVTMRRMDAGASSRCSGGPSIGTLQYVRPLLQAPHQYLSVIRGSGSLVRQLAYPRKTFIFVASCHAQYLGWYLPRISASVCDGEH